MVPWGPVVTSEGHNLIGGDLGRRACGGLHRVSSMRRRSRVGCLGGRARGGRGRASAGVFSADCSHFLLTKAAASAGSEEGGGVVKHWSPWQISQPPCEVGAIIPALQKMRNEKMGPRGIARKVQDQDWNGICWVPRALSGCPYRSMATLPT